MPKRWCCTRPELDFHSRLMAPEIQQSGLQSQKGGFSLLFSKVSSFLLNLTSMRPHSSLFVGT